MGISFNDMMNPPQKNLVIIDGLNLAFRFKRANKTSFAAEYVSTVQSFGKSYKAKDIIVLGDAGSRWRKDIYPLYKANRDELRAKQTEQEKQEFEQFLGEFIQAYKLCSECFLTFRFDGCEADDIAAYLTKRYYGEYDHTWLISSDRDWDLLVNDSVSRFSYLTRKETTVSTWEQIYSYPQSMAVSMKVLSGDKGDNVPKPEGLGEKRAYGLLREYGSALDVYDELPIQDSKKYIQNLNKFGEQLLVNYQLVDLESYCEDALGQENISIIERVMNERT
jgi:5'-3' exonuclease